MADGVMVFCRGQWRSRKVGFVEFLRGYGARRGFLSSGKTKNTPKSHSLAWSCYASMVFVYVFSIDYDEIRRER